MKRLFKYLLLFLFLSSSGFSASWQKINAGAATSSGLLSFFQFDGNLNDTQGLNSLTATNTSFASGNIGQSLHFNGASSFCVFGSTPPISNELTISTWIKTTQSGTYGTIISNAPTQYAAAIKILLDTNGKVNARRGSSSGLGGTYLVSASSSTSINNGSYHHLVVTSDVASLKIYINGVLEATSVYSGGAVLAPQLYLGKDVDQSGVSFNYFNGNMDSLRVYSRALTPSEIQSIYQAGN